MNMDLLFFLSILDKCSSIFRVLMVHYRFIETHLICIVAHLLCVSVNIFKMLQCPQKSAVVSYYTILFSYLFLPCDIIF